LTAGISDRPLRVVFIDHIARLSGGEIALLRLLPALAPHVNAHVILGESGPLEGRLSELRIESEVIPLAERVRDLRKGTLRPGGLDPRALLPVPAYVARLRRRIKQLDADLVHTNSLKAALYGGVAARLARVPVVWHIRDRISEDYLPPSAVRLVRTAARYVPTAIVANSQATLDTIPERPASSVLYNPVVPDVVALRPHEGRARVGTELTVGIVGRLAPWKGQDVFLDAFALAFRGSAVRGRVIGSALFGEDEYAAHLKDRARHLGIEEQVEFRGFREDVWEELAQLDVVVHASVLPEPFGQVVLEAMAARRPVIATARGGPSELITDGVDGLLTRERDAEALAAALRRLRDDPPLRQRLADAAFERAREFTPERAAEQLLEVYGAIMRG
jgi:glycosyltransferase involved in cell wall biosynthesis